MLWQFLPWNLASAAAVWVCSKKYETRYEPNTDHPTDASFVKDLGGLGCVGLVVALNANHNNKDEQKHLGTFFISSHLTPPSLAPREKSN